MSVLLTTFRVPFFVTVACIIGALFIGNAEAALLLTLLAILEISISFDNAIVNATVLKTMSKKWQQIFLTWGILIAVFGMRLVFPIVIVAAAAGIGIPTVLDMAINDQNQYAERLEEANAVISAFGGMFLLLVFLAYFFDEDKDVHWLGPIEKGLSWVHKRVSSISVAIAATALLVIQAVADPADRIDILISGLAGLVAYLVVKGVADGLEPEDVEEGREDHAPAKVSGKDVAATYGKAGFAAFMYLEVLDASFSFDGVIGAFAISKNIFIIAVGLGVGALYIRTMTVYLVRQGTLNEYVYLEHGAHWAIGALAVLLFAGGVGLHVPELVTGSIGAGLILAAFVASLRYNKHHRDDDGPAGGGDEPVEDKTPVAA